MVVMSMYFVSVKEMLQGNCQQQTQRREGKGLQDMMEWEMVSGETLGSSCRPNCQSTYIYCGSGK